MDTAAAAKKNKVFIFAPEALLQHETNTVPELLLALPANALLLRQPL
jgi:hypothetical protein